MKKENDEKVETKSTAGYRRGADAIIEDAATADEDDLAYFAPPTPWRRGLAGIRDGAAHEFVDQETDDPGDALDSEGASVDVA